MTEKTAKPAGLTIRPEISKVKNARGRVVGYRAKIGHAECEGETPAAAVAALRSYLSQEGEPPFIRSTSDGAIWVCSGSFGHWSYRICRPSQGGHTTHGSCSTGDTRGECIAAMERHRLQYQADLDAAVAE